MTQEEFYNRLSVFSENYERVEKHNALFEAGGPNSPEFTLEINKFADLTEEEFLDGYTGLVVPAEKTRKM